MHFTLEELGLVDAPAEQEFDNLTCLASELLDVPVAHVSVADFRKKRIFYKSQSGHPDELAASRELPMELTYCQHVPLTGAPVVVSDARLHPLLVGTPALSEGQPLAYLGIPVEAPGGKVIGGLCMMQPEERRWTPAEIGRAQKIAGCVSDLIRLKTARLSSERLRREQREFTYAISHDLQSPANTLKMIFGELACEEDSMSSDARMFVETGLATVERMGVQVQDVLTYSRTVDAPIKVDSIDLNSLVKAIVSDLAADVRAACATVELGDLPAVQGDAMQLRMLFQNLIANALKFRHNERDHQVSVYATRHAQGYRITVEDNGIGIREADQEKVFGLFNRLNLRDQYGGTGIGLSLCQRVAENHHLAIEVISDGHSGTTFSLEFPGAQP
ncbi:GAF domain-containing sensor histidine kinase [Granulosicoccus sp. 3-233]|uniref:GAF domain-containing sensor histidine kinase n=1 Tax=Granulosicoccus sp. 3-233 TaxID=3417969 RepID=UPI003D32CBF3